MAAQGLPAPSLIEAIRTGDVREVICALEAGADIEQPDMHGYPGLPLRTACFEGNPAIVGALLERGANPDTPTGDGPGAPLRLALRRGHQAVVDLLRQATLPSGLALTEPAVTAADPLPGEATPPPRLAPAPADEIDPDLPFGTETQQLSMDLLFLDEDDANKTSPPADDVQP